MTERHRFIVGLIADDVTGANDAAVQFAHRGWTAFLVLGSDPLTKFVMGSDTGPLLLAYSTDARALGNDVAERVTARAVEQLVDAGVDRVYLKIDSTMRGSVAGQISGALAAWRAIAPGAFAAICPAYPEMRRTVEANHVVVDGIPVERSPIGRDAVTPVNTGDLAALLPGSTYMKKGYGPFSTGAPEKGPYPFFATFDAQSDLDLATLASAIVEAGRSAIPVGSAGLAKAMAAAWAGATDSQPDLNLPPNPRILIQVTSLNPVSLTQTARLSAIFPDVRVVTGRADEASTVFEDYMKSETWDVLGFVGGDGARAGIQRLGASAIRIVDSLIEGVPLGIIAGGHADGIPVFTKAGGFGAEDALVRIVERFRA